MKLFSYIHRSLLLVFALSLFSVLHADSMLNNTRWQLEAFQSNDDAIGIKRPADPSLYTMMLNADGSVKMKLNCNRGMGTWKATPSAEPETGQFEFGPLAVTRALCPPPSMDEFIAMQSSYVRSYVIKDGKLYLNLMADGGDFIWQALDEDQLESKEK